MASVLIELQFVWHGKINKKTKNSWAQILKDENTRQLTPKNEFYLFWTCVQRFSHDTLNHILSSQLQTFGVLHLWHKKKKNTKTKDEK